MMSFLFSLQINQISLTKWRIFLWYMAAISYSWQRFLLPCGCPYHKSYHRIKPKHSHVDSCTLNREYSLMPPKGTFGHIVSPCWQVFMCMSRLLISCFNIKWRHFPPLEGRSIWILRIPTLCQNHIKDYHIIYQTTFCLIQTTLLVSISLSSILASRIAGTSHAKELRSIKWRRKKNMSFSNEREC